MCKFPLRRRGGFDNSAPRQGSLRTSAAEALPRPSATVGVNSLRRTEAIPQTIHIPYQRMLYLIISIVSRANLRKSLASFSDEELILKTTFDLRREIE